MKKIILLSTFFCAFSSVFAQIGDRLIVNNTTSCSVWVDFYAWQPGCAANPVNTALIIAPGTTITRFSVLEYFNRYNVQPPFTPHWTYGLIGNFPGCTPPPPAPPCTTDLLYLSDGGCGGASVLSGCVNVDAGCNGGCGRFNVSIAYDFSGNCTMTITP